MKDDAKTVGLVVLLAGWSIVLCGVLWFRPADPPDRTNSVNIDPGSNKFNVWTNTIYTTNSIQHPVLTNFFDNGLGAWLTDTNHTFGPWAAKAIHIMQMPDGKFYLRWKNGDGVFGPLFQNDYGHDSDVSARRALSLNISLHVHKALCDGIEDALRAKK